MMTSLLNREQSVPIVKISSRINYIQGILSPIGSSLSPSVILVVMIDYLMLLFHNVNICTVYLNKTSSQPRVI